MGACIINRTAGVVKIDQTYNSTSANAQSGVAVTQAINALDGTVSGSAGAAKTLTAFSQTNGKVSATFGNISITKSQVSDFSHTHGNIANDGKVTATFSPGNGSYFLMNNSNNVTNGLKFWSGTLSQYNAISSKDGNTLYYVTN